MTPMQIQAMSAVGQVPAILPTLLGMTNLTKPAYNLVISNVPGPRTTQYFNGAELMGTYPLSVPIDGNALNITCNSYADQMAFGLTGCRRTVPHLQRILTHLDTEITALEKAAGSRPFRRSRRTPPTDLLRHRPQPRAGDVGDGGVAGEVGVGARTRGLGRVDADAAAGAAVGDVLERHGVPGRAAAGEEVHHHRVGRHRLQDPAHQPGRLGRLEDVAEDLLELGDGRVGGADLLGQPDRAQLLAPTPGRVAVQPVLLEHVDPGAVASLDDPADEVVGPLLDQRRRPPPHRRAAVAEDGLDLLSAVEGRHADPTGLRVAPHREVQGAGRDGVELLVGVAQRQVPVAAPVRLLQREVRRVHRLRAARVEHALAGIPRVRQHVLVTRREPLPQLPALGVEVDDDLGEEARATEHLVHQQPQSGRLVVVDADEDRSRRSEHLAGRLQPRPHHRHPVIAPEVVAVGEGVARVVGRVDVDQVDGLDPCHPAEHVEVVALDEGVPHAHEPTVGPHGIAIRDVASIGLRWRRIHPGLRIAGLRSVPSGSKGYVVRNTTAEGVTVRLFGGVACSVGERDVDIPPGAPTLAFALLALHAGQRVSSDVLAESLGERPEDHVAALQQALDGSGLEIDRTRDSYRLACRPEDVDVLVVLRAPQSRSDDDRRKALAASKAPLLPGAEHPWVTSWRDRVDAAREALLLDPFPAPRYHRPPAPMTISRSSADTAWLGVAWALGVLVFLALAGLVLILVTAPRP